MLKSNTVNALLMTFFLLLAVVVEAFAGHALLKPEEYSLVTDAVEKTATGTVVRFDLSAIPSEVDIDLAQLKLVANFDTTSEATVNVVVHAALSDWNDETALSSESLESADTLSCNQLSVPLESDAITVDVTDIVRRWHSKKLANNGFAISTPEEAVSKTFSVGIDGEGVQVQLSVFFSK